jgi:N-acyl homoserine lactone hydrolase
MKEKTRVRRMFILDGGSFLYVPAMMKYGSDERDLQRIIVPFFAFDTEEGWVLYDTGWSPKNVPILEEMGREPHIAEENFVLGQLAKIGVPAQDVATVVISHLHVDHIGGIQHFPEARILVQKDELAYARHTSSFQAEHYNRKLLDRPNIRWEPVDGDEVVMPGLAVALLQGHTPGLQGIIVDLPDSGFFLLGADCAYLMENIEQELPPGGSWNPVLAQYGIKRFKTLQALLGGRFLPGHDYDYYHGSLNLGEAYR